MRITPKCYARSLYESIEGKNAGEVTVISKKFVEVIAKNNHLTKADTIIAEFVKIWNEKKGIVEAKVVTSKKMDAETARAMNKHLINLSNAKEVVLSETVDKNILGGAIVSYGDTVIDASLKARLNDLREQMI